MSWYDLSPARARKAARRFDALAYETGREVAVYRDGRVGIFGAGEGSADRVLLVASHILRNAIQEMHRPWLCGMCGDAAELPDGICADCYFEPERPRG